MTWTDQARRQAGVIARAQLLDAGLSSAAVDGLIRRGRVETTRCEAIYRVSGAPHIPEAECWIAALGTGSALSYLTAAGVWAMSVPTDGLLHVTRFERRRLDWPVGVRVHRVALDPSAVTARNGLLVTTPRETALDCLGWLRLSEARSFADRAIQQGWLTTVDIQRRLDEQPGRWGNKRLRMLLSDAGDGAQSKAERRLHELLRNAAVTGWQANFAVVIGGRRFVIDIAFPHQRLAIEVDGYRYHSSPYAFQSDRSRQNALAGAGWTVLRFTWSDLVDDGAAVIGAIVTLLAA